MKKVKMIDILLSILRISASVYLGLCLLLIIIQSTYVYYPEKNVSGSPEDLGMEYEDITVLTPDGKAIACWFVPCPKGSENPFTVLFCHGNAGNIGDRTGSVRTFHDMGMNVMIFDYRGYGNSTGRASEQGSYSDAKAVWDYLASEKGVPASNVIIFGRSLGGSVASWLAVEASPAGLIVESTFSSAPAMASRMFPYLPTKLLCRFKYDSLSRIGIAGCPVVVAHSRDDESVPYEHGRQLFAAAAEPKLFVELTGGHNCGGLDSHADARDIISKFIEKNCR